MTTEPVGLAPLAPVTVTAPEDTVASSWRQTTRSIWRRSVLQVRGHDVIVLTAAMSFFGALAVVPLLLIAVRLTAFAVSPARLLELSQRLGDALPTGLGAQSVVDLLVHAGLSVSALGVVLAVVPVTVYGEGLRRVLLRLQGPGAAGRDSGTSWRGRVSVVPLVFITPLLLILLLLGAGWVADLQDDGGAGSTALAVVVGYYTMLAVLLVPVGWTFRVVAAGRVRVRPLLVGAFLTAASLAGFCSGPGHLPRPTLEPWRPARGTDRRRCCPRRRALVVPAPPRAAGGLDPHPGPAATLAST